VNRPTPPPWTDVPQRRSTAPWTDDQVASLNGYQRSGVMHPLTGGRGPDGAETVLTATTDGWVERVGGPVVQAWAHGFMADWSWKSLDWNAWRR
jgi:hypothetical protein